MQDCITCLRKSLFATKITFCQGKLHEIDKIYKCVLEKQQSWNQSVIIWWNLASEANGLSLGLPVEQVDMQITYIWAKTSLFMHLPLFTVHFCHKRRRNDEQDAIWLISTIESYRTATLSTYDDLTENDAWLQIKLPNSMKLLKWAQPQTSTAYMQHTH